MKRSAMLILAASMASGCATPRWVKQAYVWTYDAATEKDAKPATPTAPAQPDPAQPTAPAAPAVPAEETDASPACSVSWRSEGAALVALFTEDAQAANLDSASAGVIEGNIVGNSARFEGGAEALPALLTWRSNGVLYALRITAQASAWVEGARP